MAGLEGLKVYQLSYRLAMMIFHDTKSFPKEEKFSLTDQVQRSSRSVVTNLAEGYRKRQYPKVFLNKLSDSDGEIAETQTWLRFAHDCDYLSATRQQELLEGYKEVGRMLGAMMAHPEKFS